MDELLPILLGTLVGLATARARRRTVLAPVSCIAAGWVATLATGEITASPWYVCADVALAATGCVAAVLARRAWDVRRARRAEPAAVP